MDSTALTWRDRFLLLAGWGVALWAAFNACVADLVTLWERPLLGVVPPTRGVLIGWWVLVAAAITLLFGWLAIHRRGVLRERPAAYPLLLFGFTLVVLYGSQLPARHAAQAARVLAVLLAVAAVLWLFYRREDVSLEAITLTFTWAALLGTARASFPARPFDFTPFVGAGSVGMATYLVGQVVQVPLLALPLALALPPLRRLGARWLDGLVGWPVGLHGALIALAVLARAAYTLSAAARLLTPVVLVHLLLLAGTASAGALALRAIRRPGRGQDRPPAREIDARTYRLGLLAVAAAYAALSVPLIGRLVTDVNPDGFAYLKIARDYAAGHAVVRGYWAPLMSWLLALPIALGANPQLAQRVLSGLAGLAWVGLSVLLAQRLGLGRTARLALAILMALFVLEAAYALVVPDVVAASLVALYFVVVLDPRYVEKPVLFGLVAGGIGGLAYLGKYYSLPFVVAHLVLTGGLLVLRGQRPRRVLAATAAGLVATVIVALPWILLLSARYGYPTISTSGAINHALVGPSGTGHPCVDNQPCPRPADVLFPWEEPLVDEYPDAGWSALSSLDLLNYQLGLLRENATRWATSTSLYLGLLIPATLGALALAALVGWQDARRRFLMGWLVLTCLLYAAGYMPAWAQDFRYYYPIIPLALGGFFLFLEAGITRLRTAAGKAQGTHMLLSVLLVAGPALAFTDFVDLTSQLQRSVDPCLEADSLAMREYLVAPLSGPEFTISQIAYYTGIRTVGGVGDVRHDPPAVDASLHEHGVATFVTPSDLPLTSALVDDYGYEVVARLPLCGVEQTILRVP